MTRLKVWNQHPSWEKAEAEWDSSAKVAAKIRPLKKLKKLPTMPQVTSKTAKWLKLKSLKYMITHDQGGKILRHFLKHPFRYGFRYLRSLMNKETYKREGDFFFYGLSSCEAFQKELQKETSLLIVGFSYCQKPFECPSGRFTDQCIHDPNHPVCQQCDIGKVMNALPEDKVIPLIIPTIHYIGDQIFQLVHAHPNKQVLFLITACELTLKMFGDWGHMANIRGIGVRLDGRICNTLQAFELSERGIKPGLTVVTSETQSHILALIRQLRSKNTNTL